jgi:hypothetical protein
MIATVGNRARRIKRVRRGGRHRLPARVPAAVAALVLLTGAACSGDTEQAAGPVTWTGGRALTADEDAPRGVATDGTRVFFTTGRTQVGENALRVATIEGEATSHIVATTPGGLIPNGHVALDGDVVYVAAGRSIVRLPVAGGDATVVVDGRPAGIDNVVVAGDDLWWTTYQYLARGRVEVARMPKAGGPVEVVAINVADALNDPQPDGGAALVGTPDGVLRVRAGAPPEVVVSDDALGGAVTALAIDGERLYVLIAGNKHRLLAIPRRGGAPVELADDIDSTADLAVVGDQVLFFRAGGVGSGGRAQLQAVPGTGGAERTIASGRYADGDLAAVGTDRVVFSADGVVWVASVSG